MLRGAFCSLLRLCRFVLVLVWDWLVEVRCYVQLGKLEDALAEFVLDVADAVLDVVSLVLDSSAVLVVLLEVRTTMQGFLGRVSVINIDGREGRWVLTDASCASHGGHDDGGDGYNV